MRAAFFGDAKTRITRLLEVVSNKLNLPSTQPLGLLMASGGAGAAPASPGNTALVSGNWGGEWVRVVFEGGESIKVDGKPWGGAGVGEVDEDVRMGGDVSMNTGDERPGHGGRKRRRVDGMGSDGGSVGGIWTVRTGQWRLRIQQAAHNGKSGIECVFVGVKIEAFTGERARNLGRGFLVV